MDCIFCKMLAGQAPMHLIWEDEAHVAFLSSRPNTPGFSVVVPGSTLAAMRLHSLTKCCRGG